jgi:AcrR family transcriptional regulator
MNEIVARRQRSERQNRMNKVINAARKLFFKNGYQNTTVRDIALKAHFSTGVIYFYFNGKGDIYGKICEQGYHLLLDIEKEAAATEGTVLEKIKAVAHAYVKFYIKYPEYFDIVSNRCFRQLDLPVEIIKKQDKLSTQALAIPSELMEEAIRQGVIIDYEGGGMALLLLFWAFLIGVITLHWRGDLDKYSVDFAKLVDFQIDLFLEGITRQDNPPSAKL